MNRLFNFVHKMLGGRRKKVSRSFADLFDRFNSILELNNRILTSIAVMHSKLGGDYIFDTQYLRNASQELETLVLKLIGALDYMSPEKYIALYCSHREITEKLHSELAGYPAIADRLTVTFEGTTKKEFDLVGAKSYNLARISNIVGIKTPAGITVTTRSCMEFMEYNDLNSAISDIKTEWLEGSRSLSSTSEEISKLIMAGDVPPRLRKALNRVGDQLFQKSEKGVGLAVRSSAWGEDGRYSFAGLYESFINVPYDKLQEAYLKVLASIYSPAAMEYRQELGYKISESLMAVSFQTVTRAKCSGVVYTLSPSAPSDNTVVISATWGMGSAVVSGEVSVDQFIISKDEHYESLGVSIARKKHAVRLNPEGAGVVKEDVSEEMQSMPCLNSDEITQLVQAVIKIEQYHKKPQDVEFAFDESGQLYILQTRPLAIHVPDESTIELLSEKLSSCDVIFSGKGDVAQKGIASGPVFIAGKGRNLDEFPDGAILVAPHSSPIYASLMHRAGGLLTNVGSPLGHLATIAREYRVPALLNTENVMEVLTEGQMITVDVEQQTIYSGIIKELNLYEAAADRIEETYEYRLLRRLLKHIEPLNLFDPADSNFTPTGCVTFHDIARFVHEKAVDELISININSLYSSSPSVRLDLPVPLDMTLIDIGGGLICTDSEDNKCTDRKTITPDHIVSTPMKAFIDGVTTAGVWESSPVSVDFSSFMSSMTRTFPAELASSSSVGRNLAVISNNYAHLSLHLGYHFTMINSYVSENISENYAYFRFAGGVTEAKRRTRRAKFIAEVLGKLDFSLKLREDLLIARIKKIPANEILRRVEIFGVLVAYTRQIDVSMVDDEQIHRHAEAFSGLIKNLI